MVGYAVREPDKAYDFAREIWRDTLPDLFRPRERYEPVLSSNENAEMGVSPTSIDLGSTPPQPEHPSWIATTYRNEQIGCAMDLGSGWRTAPAIIGWDRTFKGPYGVMLCVHAVPTTSPVSITVEDVEAWVNERATASGYTNVRLADSGAEDSDGGPFAWALFYGDKAGGEFPFHGAVLPLDSGQLQLMFTNDEPGWDDAHADVVTCALQGLRPESAPASMTAPVARRTRSAPTQILDTPPSPITEPVSVSYAAQSLDCSFGLGSGWMQVETTPGWSATFSGPHGVNLGIFEEPLDNDPARTITVATVQDVVSRQLTATDHTQVRIVGSGVSNTGDSQYAWARADGTIDGEVWTYYLCIVPLSAGNLHLLFYGTTPGWDTDRYLTVKSAMED